MRLRRRLDGVGRGAVLGQQRSAKGSSCIVFGVLRHAAAGGGPAAAGGLERRRPRAAEGRASSVAGGPLARSMGRGHGRGSAGVGPSPAPAHASAGGPWRRHRRGRREEHGAGQVEAPGGQGPEETGQRAADLPPGAGPRGDGPGRGRAGGTAFLPRTSSCNVDEACHRRACRTRLLLPPLLPAALPLPRRRPPRAPVGVRRRHGSEDAPESLSGGRGDPAPQGPWGRRRSVRGDLRRRARGGVVALVTLRPASM
mmetsp:Transcript_54090/g.157110  ORF Transcript_54090/g.157110 Transcript_54090/m.157110 type:complete len:255 (-) Transcript_54090:114-878(-)